MPRAYAAVGASTIVATTESLAALIDHRALGRALWAAQLREVLAGAEEAGTATQYDFGWQLVEDPS